MSISKLQEYYSLNKINFVLIKIVDLKKAKISPVSLENEPVFHFENILC
jgi:hypothetical protein